MCSDVPHFDEEIFDHVAARRFEYARAAATDGAWGEAAEMFEQTIERAPDWAGAWVALGEARSALGDPTRATDAYRRAIALDPGDRLGASLRLAAIDPATTGRASAGYVSALFDAYAARFEAHLSQGLAYHGPADLVAAMEEMGRRRFARAIDLGCGTGLGGVALRPLTGKLIGVDLSVNMIGIARDKAIYDRLEVADILAFLRAQAPASADLVFAADVFIYVGDLAPVVTEAARVLGPNGTIAFTAQRCAVGICVGADMRFAHSLAYVDGVLQTCGFRSLVLRENSARREKGEDVPGLVAIATRR